MMTVHNSDVTIPSSSISNLDNILQSLESLGIMDLDHNVLTAFDNQEHGVQGWRV